MAMPPQLARGLWLKRHYRRTEQRPLAECLPHINVNDLSIPRDYKTYIAPNISFRYPHISSMRINWNMVQFAHSERIQTFKFKWIKTGFGYPRPTFICECGRPVIKLYFRSTNLSCRRCCNATYASRACSRKQRPALQTKRLQAFLEFKTYMSRRNRNRIKARIPTASTQDFKSKRLSHHSITVPQSNYSTRGAMHWR
jgi:hypothetical protein